MQPVAITCKNHLNSDSRNQPVALGVPLAQGQAFLSTSFLLKDTNGSAVPVQTEPLNFWPDGSIKWLLCDFIAGVGALSTAQYHLETTDLPVVESRACDVQMDSDCWRISTGRIEISIAADRFKPFNKVISLRSGQEICGEGEIRVLDDGGRFWESHVEKIVVETSGPVRTTMFLCGQIRGSDRRCLNFEERLHLYAGSSRLQMELRLHNPDAARHPENLWDLGDPSSVMLKEWSMRIPFSPSSSAYRMKVAPGKDIFDVCGAHGNIYQEASGGKHWNSPVHRNHTGAVPMLQRGWVYSDEGRELSGERAQPALFVSTGQAVTAAAIESFWQRFPKQMKMVDNHLELGLMPGCFPGGHELQGGEQITERVVLDFDASEQYDYSGPSSLSVRCETGHYQKSNVFSEGLWEPRNNHYRSLLALARDGEKGFKAKREQLDEYGWRNFGELYADHESAFHKEDKPFISHYNNQYDPLYSFYRLYLSGCDDQWEELARDLAFHIQDIDINHTDKDREEYCNGLFWHTDHYLDAGLSTHRMASREHRQFKNPALCGGGPAAEHCYSGGLMLHHLMTGDPRSRKLVLSMAEWCWISLRGPQTMGAASLRTIKNGKQVSHGPGAIWPEFPFTRGTGNCLNTTLDAFELTGSNDYMIRAAEMIRKTIHPEDDPLERDLLDAEIRWSYTVFLSALGRFLSVKKAWGRFDRDFNYARLCLLTYARWMAEHEYPYLEKPEILEFPNETWAAQDLRKGVVFYYTAKYAEKEEQQLFLDRAAFYLDYGLRELHSSATGHYTRPLVLALQNGWAVEAVQREMEPDDFSHLPESAGRPIPRKTYRELLRRTLADFGAVLKQTGFKRELHWLRSRLQM